MDRKLIAIKINIENIHRNVVKATYIEELNIDLLAEELMAIVERLLMEERQNK
ncbi:hypothetical protein [Ectobacillus panaciterrae]|uniref:hypothetical protein n=1 Tax=Ectobacillus panaciterrae TaxID=363872 RepID=UPI000428F299|nr:hypothetical protein [Ectobacillus panaciterrae]